MEKGTELSISHFSLSIEAKGPNMRAMSIEGGLFSEISFPSLDRLIHAHALGDGASSKEGISHGFPIASQMLQSASRADDGGRMRRRGEVIREFGSGIRGAIASWGSKAAKKEEAKNAHCCIAESVFDLAKGIYLLRSKAALKLCEEHPSIWGGGRRRSGDRDYLGSMAPNFLGGARSPISDAYFRCVDSPPPPSSISCTSPQITFGELMRLRRRRIDFLGAAAKKKKNWKKV